jgi:amidohydrolase
LEKNIVIAAIQKALTKHEPMLLDLNRWLYEHPETGENEHLASAKLMAVLADEGFCVTAGIAGLPTAFRAEYSLGGDGLSVGLLAEYDALPDIGHGCGHNIIAASCIGTALALKESLAGSGGQVVVFGTPAEETIGGKIQMTNQGAFWGIDIAMSVHPSHRSAVGGSSLASHPLEITFKGRPAHAAAAPQDGINALDALVEAYMAMRMLRVHMRDDVRMPGIITYGGAVPNIVPEKAVARFSLRAADSDYLETVIEKVKACARGAAMASGATVDFHHYEPLFEAMNNNAVMGSLFAKHLQELGYPVEYLKPTQRGGSTDVGNVSQIVPTIHPSIAIGADQLSAHTREFAEATVSSQGEKALMDAALAMAMTVVDIKAEPALLDEIRDEFGRK